MRLKQIATINAGYPFRGKIPEVPGSAMVAVQMKDVSLTEGIRWSDCLETELTGKREPDYLTTGDILVAARGSHNYAVQVDQALATIGKQAVAAPHFFVISLKKKDILPEFLVWLLNQTPAQRYFEQNAEGTLTKSIRRSVLEDVPVVVPPLAKQRAIISMAATLRDEHKLIQKLVSNGERMMSAIAKDLFENKEVSP
ncbi:restriction endonuclease subunit S [Shewanella sp. GD04112]|uniref:restriction endonuclease subunit S n=1 Tax=Shewanella sp. GD04112 TaxID=2975434 RepID=UPI0024479850|nr:restriction endonuclease subunit S [Shewanella sp. GD04112]MDH0450842.1 restriction endonuclease subunit S [Shewanella sp. GD04112]